MGALATIAFIALQTEINPHYYAFPITVEIHFLMTLENIFMKSLNYFYFMHCAYDKNYHITITFVLQSTNNNWKLHNQA